MKIWLDDIRMPPSDWHWSTTFRATNANSAIHCLENYDVEEISLDHDLGEEINGTGYDVICWIEEKVFTDENYIPPKIFIHSANPVGRKRMQVVIERIERR